MPWEVRKSGSRFCVYKEGASEPLHCYDTEAEAERYMRALYAHMPAHEKKGADMLVALGGAVKASADGRVSGYLITFADADHPDTSSYRDFFTPATDYGVDWQEENGIKTAPVFFHHGMDEQIGKRRLGRGTLKMDDVGVWIEAKIREREEWEQAVGYLARKERLGWSSGAPAHLVEREPVQVEGKMVAHRVLCWPIAEASLTTRPAEPTNDAYAVKSLAEWRPEPLPSTGEFPFQVAGTVAASALSLAEHSEAVVSANSDYARRLSDRLEARVKAGRVLSAANVRELEEVLSSLDGLSAIRERVVALLEKAKPAEPSSPAGDEPATHTTADEGARLRRERDRLSLRARAALILGR